MTLNHSAGHNFQFTQTNYTNVEKIVLVTIWFRKHINRLRSASLQATGAPRKCSIDSHFNWCSNICEKSKMTEFLNCCCDHITEKKAGRSVESPLIYNIFVSALGLIVIQKMAVVGRVKLMPSNSFCARLWSSRPCHGSCERNTPFYVVTTYFTQQNINKKSGCSAKSPLGHNVFGLALRLKVLKFILKLHTFTSFDCSWPTSLETELSWASLT